MFQLAVDDFLMMVEIHLLLCFFAGFTGAFLFYVLPDFFDLIGDLLQSAHKSFFPRHYYRIRARMFHRAQKARAARKRRDNEHFRKYGTAKDL